MKNYEQKRWRRIKYLTSILERPYPFTEEMIAYLRGDTRIWPEDVHKKINCLGEPGKRVSIDLYRELFRLIKESGVDIKSIEAVRNWTYENWYPHHSSLFSYGTMPRPPKKDNKTYRNGSGRAKYMYHYSERSILRFPKKKRKTAWKRFYRLFPHLKKQRA